MAEAGKNSFEWGGTSNGNVWGGKKRSVRVSDKVPILDVSDGDWHLIRQIGPVVFHRMHWITFKPKPDAKPITIPKFCLEAHGKLKEGQVCSWCANFEDAGSSGFQNVIDRDAQENAPRKPKLPTKYEETIRTVNGYEGFYKEAKGAGGYTPNVVLQIDKSLGELIAGTVALNRVKTKKGKKTFPPDHPIYGYDIQVKYDKSKAFNARWSVQREDRVRLTDEELDYLLWKIPNPEVETFAEAEKECAQLMKKACNREGEPTFPDLYEGAQKKGKKKNQYSDQFDEDEDLEEDKPKKRSKSRARDEDDDEEAPPKRRGSKSREVFEEDEEDEEDEEEEDDEDEAPPRRSSKQSSKTRSRSRDEDDDEPAPRRSKSSSGKSSNRRHEDLDDDIPF